MSQTDSRLDSNTAIPPIDLSIPDKTETFTFALGCFSGPDCKFGVMEGVVRTRVDNPTSYKELP